MEREEGEATVIDGKNGVSMEAVMSGSSLQSYVTTMDSGAFGLVHGRIFACSLGSLKA